MPICRRSSISCPFLHPKLSIFPLISLLIVHLPFSSPSITPMTQLGPSSPNASNELSAPIIFTSHGQIRGKTFPFEWGKADAFYGIPYAQPPVGKLKFEKPRPLADWDGIRNATELAPMPFPWVHPHKLDKKARLDQFSEDCLYLNLFRPQIEENSTFPHKLMPVLVIIHGGGFQKGSTRRYGYFDEITRKYLKRGILVAVVGFRIGVLAFASNGQSDFAGNLAYWDQTEALRWLQRNLAAFGGDPKRVTLFGYSSGSMSVGTLSVSPHSRDLFAQSIQMSGPLMLCRAACDQVEIETIKLARAIGCLPGQNVKEFLKGKSIEELFEGVEKIGSSRADLNYVKFGPRIDGDFLPADFSILIGESAPKPTIIGINEMEPLQSLLFGKDPSLHWDAIPKEQFPTFGPAHFEEYVRRIVMPKASEFGAERRDSLVREMMEFYLGGKGEEEKSPDFYLERIVQVMEDLQFVVPLAWEVQSRLNSGRNANLFVYINNFVNGRWFPPEVRIHKAFHDNDHSYMFRSPAHADYEFDADDLRIETHWNEIIANFVQNGNPSTSTLQWGPISSEGNPNQQINRHMAMELPGPILREEFEQQKRVDFWNRMMAKYSEYNLVMGRKMDKNDGQTEGERNGAESKGRLGFLKRNGRRIVRFKQHLVSTIFILLPLIYAIYTQI